MTNLKTLRFEKTPGPPQDFRFHITYFLFDPDTAHITAVIDWEMCGVGDRHLG